MNQDACIVVVIPPYKISRFIKGEIASIGSEVSKIYVVGDCCPEKTVQLVEAKVTDLRVSVVYHREKQAVGGAVMILQFVEPILSGQADYRRAAGGIPIRAPNG